MRILVTGANGFIGTHLCDHFKQQGHQVLPVCRTGHAGENSENGILVNDIFDLSPSDLEAVDVVVHLANIAHARKTDRAQYRRVNVEGTRHVAGCCVQAGVRRLIYLSSVKAIADSSNAPLKTGIAPAPSDDYGQSKLDAERLLISHPGLEVVIVRIPLVYGRGVKGNLALLLRFLRKGIPMPVLGIQNRRSYLGVDNLCDFLTLCAESDRLRAQVFHLADGAPVSLAALVRALCDAAGLSTRSFWMPGFLVMAACTLVLGKRRAESLLGNLELDVSVTCHLTGWQPPYSMYEGLERMLASEPLET